MQLIDHIPTAHAGEMFIAEAYGERCTYSESGRTFVFYVLGDRVYFAEEKRSER